ncbi:hypothetical protein GJ744_006542 [Endocarpon pusillum]|uniref:Uncharacterized protein n=1 Tax=Endocarpon pusillum TaxID=364733 RepID=A0A8H7EA58_9EURO|nr:hypothetical protein GJ744_006542 [Endocarpon pusillum]
MKILSLVMSVGSLAHPALALDTRAMDRSRVPFSSGFRQPGPPVVQSEFRANWNQHKWDANVSHIASGFVYNSPSQRKVRVDEAYDSTFGSSLLDYTNVTQEGVANRLWTLSPAITSPPACFEGFTNPAFPLISDDFLVANNAIYGGEMDDALSGKVSSWDILYQGAIPVTVLLGEDNIIQGYDFVGPETRARAITRFFNIIVGPIGREVFEFPC